MESRDIRYLDELGRVALPAHVRNAVGWEEKTPVECAAVPGGDAVLLRRHAGACCCCGAAAELMEFSGKHFCKRCIEKLSLML